MIEVKLNFNTHLDVSYFLNEREKVVNFLVSFIEDLNNYYSEKKDRNYHTIVMANKNQIYNVDYSFLMNSFLKFIDTFDVSKEDKITIHNMFVGNDYPSQKTAHFFNYLLSQYAVRVTMNSPFFYMKTVYKNLDSNTYFLIDSVGLSIQGIQNLLGQNAIKQYLEPNVRKQEVELAAAGKSAKVMLSNARNTIGKVYSISDEMDVTL